MAMEALPLWRRLEREAGQEVLRTLGGLDVGPGIEANAAALRACGARAEVVEGTEAMRRFPGVRLDPGEPVLVQPDAGVILADRAVRCLAGRAAALGAELRQGQRVVELAVDGGGVSVRTGAEAYRAGAVVVTAGSWARGLLATAGVDLPVVPTRETVAYFGLREPVALPTFVHWEPPLHYALPDPVHGLKAGGHRTGPEADPDEPGEPDPEAVARLARWVARHFPAADPAPRHAETCLYTNTDDERFILERHGPVVVGSACSGHGFKFAPLIGRSLAELAAG
jgi:sarcosine oxidase